MPLVFRIIPLIIIFCSCNACHPLKERPDPSSFMSVVNVIDGDTFRADDGTEKGVVIRLIGVDAPETRNTGLKKASDFGFEAKDFLTDLLSGQKVRLDYDVGRQDRYGRTLAYVYLPDGTFVNAELLKQGYGMVMTVPPNVKYAEEFVKLERRARRTGKGLWK